MAYNPINRCHWLSVRANTKCNRGCLKKALLLSMKHCKILRNKFNVDELKKSWQLRGRRGGYYSTILFVATTISQTDASYGQYKSCKNETNWWVIWTTETNTITKYSWSGKKFKSTRKTVGTVRRGGSSWLLTTERSILPVPPRDGNLYRNCFSTQSFPNRQTNTYSK